MPIVTADAHGVKQAAAALRRGELVGLPTETVYGLAADARSPAAIAKVFERKARPLFDPLIVHVAPGPHAERLHGWVDPAVFDRIPASLWPGPLTLVLPRHPSVHDLVTAGLDTVAVRMPAHPVAQALIAAHGPVVAPSANRFGRISPTTPQAVIEELGDLLVLDGGPCAIGVESTILRIPISGPCTLLRPGAIDAQALERLVGPLAPPPPPGARPDAPGQLPSHYAPRTPLTLVDAWSPTAPDGSFAILDHTAAPCPYPDAVAIRTLGPSAVDAAQQLYAALRALDAVGAQRILAHRFPGHDALATAIDDRLTRAAVPAEAPVG